MPRPGNDRLLLDTNVVLWLLLGDRDKIPASVQSILEDEGNDLFLSAVVVWEIAIKRSLGKLEISDNWSVAIRQLDFTPLPITADHATRVEHLPWHHRDPFDRLLIAQARAENYALVSSDPRLSDYDVPVRWDRAG